MGINALYSDVLSFGASVDKLSKRSLSESEIGARIMFFRRVKGRLLKLFRKKKGLSVSEVAQMMGWMPDNLVRIEAGEWPVSDPIFYKLCDLLDASEHVAAFLDKAEEALRPQFHQARMELAKMLQEEGFNPVLPEELKQELQSHVLAFPPKTE